MTRPRLKIGDISIKEVLLLSENVYKKNIDNKSLRSVDILKVNMKTRKGLKYNRSNKEWDQITREVRLDFLIKTDPISYKKRDNIKIHKYPVTFLIRNWDKNFNSAFRLRVGSNYKPIFPKRKIKDGKTPEEKDKIRKQNKKIEESNIRKGIQLQFFFDSMRVFALYGLLFGPDYTNGLPKKRNPELIPFFSKHSYWIVKNVLPKMFSNAKLRQKFSNEERVEKK